MVREGTPLAVCACACACACMSMNVRVPVSVYLCPCSVFGESFAYSVLYILGMQCHGGRK